MIETPENSILQSINSQRAFFLSGKTKDLSFRKAQLLKLRKYISQHEAELCQALWNDLRKSPEEAYMTEIGLVKSEVNLHLKHLKTWAGPQEVATPVALLPSSSKIYVEPLGVSLIIAPWNYPFQLLINPLIGAMSSGCCCILKPSPDAPATAAFADKMIRALFDPEYITVIQGGTETNTSLLKQQFDVIFFTGSTRVGKIVMKAASEHLTPVVLELGGKSPCIVDKDANLDIAARRITWGKFLNAGQTCIAPDYLYVHKSVKEQLIQKISEQIHRMFGEDVAESPFYARIVNENAIKRLSVFMQDGKIREGGTYDLESRYMAPTIMDEITTESAIMQEEIFGPLLPVLSFEQLDEVIAYINRQAKPLALYYFGRPATGDYVLSKTSSGGACINDTLLHIGNHHMPFGGVGYSGTGAYHGKDSFLAFSHRKSVVTSSRHFDLPLKYAPYKYFKWVRHFL
ncbi:MAG: aldehyde dehydrogenase [Bacteroidetes bacterium]|nr:aldehyde dehydrogenase [Bacteroidota bacterium]